MSNAKALTQEKYKEARLAVANALLGNNKAKVHWDFPEADDYLRAERLIDAGLIDIEAVVVVDHAL